MGRTQYTYFVCWISKIPASDEGASDEGFVVEIVTVVVAERRNE